RGEDRRPHEGAEPARRDHLHLLHPRCPGDGPRRRAGEAGRRADRRPRGGGPGGSERRGGTMLGQVGVRLRIAFRNLFKSWINLLIGGVVLWGTFLVVVGGALLDSVVSSMSRSIIGSVAGHIQVYSARSKDDFAIWPMGGSDPDLSPITDWERTERALASVPNVKAVVPMGINAALVTSGNTVDLTLEELRNVVREQKEHGSTPELAEQRASLEEHVRQIIRVLQADLGRANEIGTRQALQPQARAAVEEASSGKFWADFRKDPYPGLEFLENKVAPQLSHADPLRLQHLDTHL